MPFSRLVDNFSPIKNPFDVIIVDEASQENPLGLAPFFMAKKVIIVGDEEQVTPLDVGGEMAPIQDLIQQWLGDLPTPELFDLKSSIYDRAKIAFGQKIMLTEHFRCVPEIIQFSNQLSYRGKITPLRDSASTAIKPALVAHRINGLRKGMSNENEAMEIVSLIAALVEFPEYEGKSIGVITLLGAEKDQVKTIDWLLQEKIDGVDLERRRILCGTPAQFQGDERDIIFHSMVDTNEGDGPLNMMGSGAGDLRKKRYNVAASRAKDQLWIVHSLNHQTDLQPGDLRRRLIEHALDPSHLMKNLETEGAKTESPFEKEVLERLIRCGYKVHPQWEVGAYRIDMVVEGGNGVKLAIECDGDRWHYNRVAEDLARQALLERLGWKFVRIRGSAFYRNPDQTMQSVFARLAELGITPMAQQMNTQILADGNSLRDRVIRRATELRREWGWDQPLVAIEC
jgi:very-short-patch-repair endonuclease